MADNDDSHSKCSLKEKYGELVERSTSHLFPGFVDNFKNQSKDQRELGRAAVLESLDGQPAQAKSFQNSRDLEIYFNSTSSTLESKPYRRLFILEDLPRNYIEILGCNLLVPPSFFAAQWAAPWAADYSRRSSFAMNSMTGFLLTYAQFYKVECRSSCSIPKKAVPAANHNIERYIHFDGNDILWESPNMARCYHKVSYWSGSAFAPSWDALILTDPQLTQRSSNIAPPSSRLQFHPETQMCPSISSPAAIPADSHHWIHYGLSPSYRSILDDVLNLWEFEGLQFSECPIESTILCRKIAAACAIGFLRRLHHNLLRGILIDKYCGSLVEWPQTYVWNIPWGSKTSEGLVHGKFCIHKFQMEISRNIAALGMDPTAMNSPSGPGDYWERIAWKDAQYWCGTVLDMIDLMIQTYSHHATIREAQLSNHIATSVGKITSLASLFIPISIVAGIFSMGADFLPGGSSFWVFWVATIPLCFVTGIYTFKAYYFQIVMQGYGGVCSRLIRRIWFKSDEALPR